MNEVAWPEYVGKRQDHIDFWNRAMEGKATGKEVYNFMINRGYV